MRSFRHPFVKSRSRSATRRPFNRVRPFVEQLENRLALSVVGLTTSSNWSGYAIEEGTNLNAPTTGVVTAAGGSWVVPTVTGTSTGYSADWVGIDGYSSNSVEQLGTEEDVVAGRHGAVTTSYYAWYEMYPNASVEIPKFTVKPGDAISAEVTYQSTSGRKSSFTLTIVNATENETFSTTQSMATPARSSAEWVVEAPSSGSRILQLDNFGTVNFTGAWATVGGTTGPVDDSAWSAIPIDIGRGSSHEDTTSIPPTDSATTGFKEPSGASSSSFTVTFNGSSNTALSSSGHGKSGSFRDVNVAAATAANDAAMVIASEARTPANRDSGPVPQAVYAVNNANLTASSQTVPASVRVPVIQSVPFSGRAAGQGLAPSNDDNFEDDGGEQCQPLQLPTTPQIGHVETNGEMIAEAPGEDALPTVDAVFTSYSGEGESLVAEPEIVDSSSAGNVAALAGLVVALSLHRSQKLDEPNDPRHARRALPTTHPV